MNAEGKKKHDQDFLLELQDDTLSKHKTKELT
jgi:hypothetical protein